jgi:hypothetical protein
LDPLWIDREHFWDPTCRAVCASAYSYADAREMHSPERLGVEMVGGEVRILDREETLLGSTRKDP